jgi:hypothetical protein
LLGCVRLRQDLPGGGGKHNDRMPQFTHGKHMTAAPSSLRF